MPVWICATCGLEHAEADTPDPICAICADERQYLPVGGQVWNTLANVQAGRRAVLRELEPNLFAIDVEPKVGIGHRPLIVQTPSGNVLWDAPGFYDDELLIQIRQLGPLVAIASSHPHLTGLSVSISHAFGGIPVWYGEDDQEWIRRPDPVINFWSRRRELLPGLALVQCGGHFSGSAVLHWQAGAGGAGAILTGDTIRVNADRKTVSFMRSYPNLIPLPARSVRQIAEAVLPLQFDRIYGGFDGELIGSGGSAIVQSSADRYMHWVSG